MNQNLEIEGRFISECFRWGECGIGTVTLVNGAQKIATEHKVRQSVIKVKGNFESDELEIGFTYRFYGRFSEYRNKTTGLAEKQFHFNSFIPVVAHDETGVVAYLESVGVGLGMGYGTAKKAWAEWGSDAVRVIRDNPRELLRVNKRITDEQLSGIGQKLQEQQAVESATIEITNLLHGRGFPKRLPRKCIKAWGNRAAEVIGKDPYRLMAFRGCGFKLCDALYLELGLNPAKLRRQALCGWYAIASDRSGDVWFPIEKIERAIKEAIGAKANPAKAIELGRRLGQLSPDHYGAIALAWSRGVKGPLVGEQEESWGGGSSRPRVWVAEGRNARVEERLARMVQEGLDEDRPRQLTHYEMSERVELDFRDHVRCHRCSRQLTAPEVHVWNGLPFGPTCIQSISDGEGVSVVGLSDWMESHPIVRRVMEERPKRLVDLPEYSLWPDPADLEIDAHQREKLAELTVGRICILGGSPGTGKTFTVAQLVKSLLQSGKVSPEDIAIAAPTGKAAVRVTENLVANGLPVRARTLHSLLGMGERNEESGEFSFRFNERNPWDFRVIIVDESSMVDLSLMHALFAARPRGCHVMLVGDINQLPPVGCGAPLRDLISAGVPYAELTEIKRATGGIVEACAAIRDGKAWVEGDNLHVVHCDSPEKQLDAIEKVIDRCGGVFNRQWDIQVLCVVNLRSPLSRNVLNGRLQSFLNANPEISGSPFRLGDKIICTKNGYYSLTDPGSARGLEEDLVDEDGRVYVANGEMGKVLEMEANKMVVELYHPSREIVVPRGKGSDKSSDDAEESSTGCQFELACAITFHKSQGSEYPVVIIVLDEYPGSRRICDRSLLYTGISRGKSKVYLIGKKATADAMCKRNNIGRRKTFLRERIALFQAEKVLELI